jgi:carboxyl-terminal processing protease
MRPRAALGGVFAALVLLLSFGGGVAFDRIVLKGNIPTEPADAQGTFGVFWEAWQLVETNFVDQSVVTPVTLTHGAISGMLDALGDTGHTRFLSPSDRKVEQDNLAGRLEGIGIEVEVRDGRVVVVAPLDNSPAQKAGILPGDTIMKVNDQDATQLPLDRVSALIRGPQGTPVKLTILRANVNELLDFSITRQEVKVADVTWATVPGEKIAHIRISSFGDSTDSELKSAIAQARQAGDTRFIVDLRNDPGGLLDQAVQVASEFLGSGTVVVQQDRSGKQEPIKVQAGGVAPKEPIAVLVNHGTASAAEIVAGALQDQQRATVIGEQTFGTGTILTEYPLSDGSSILLGVREWLTPNGHSIRRNGITPDHVVPLAPTVSSIVPLGERSMTPDQLAKSGDAQLLEAVKDLR